MNCPRCGAPVAPPQPHCPDCSFSLATVIETFGHRLVRLDRVTDAANCLRLREAEMLDDLVEEFEASFPQVFFATYFGVLPPSFTLGELSFWLLNHAAFNTKEFKKLNEYAVLLVIDPVGKCAGINVGYALEPFLTPARLDKILKRIRTPLWHGELVNAVTSALEMVSAFLRKGAVPARPMTSLLPPETTQEFMGRSGLESLKPGSGTAGQDFDWNPPKPDSSPDDDRPWI